MSNTILIVFNIGNDLDDTTATKVIAVHKETGLDSQIEYIKSRLDQNVGEFILRHYQLRLSNEDIYCDTANEHDEVWSDLKSIGLLK